MTSTVPRTKVGLLTAASALGIASPGFIHHGLAAIGPFLIAAFTLSKSSYGFLVSAFSLVGAISSPTLGTLADRIGGVRLLRWAFALAIGVSVGMALAPNILVLFGVAMIGGLTASAANPATNTLIGSHVPVHRRGIIVGIKQAGGPLGIAAAGAAMPAIADTWGWEWAVLSGAVLPAIGLVLLWWSGAKPGERRPRRDRTTAREPLGPRITILTINATAVGWGLGAILGFISVYGVEEIGMAETTAGALLTVVGVIGVGARLMWGAIADRTRGSTGLLAAMSTVALASGLGIWASSSAGVGLLIVSTVLFGTSAMAWNAVGMLAVIREASRERAGAASGVVVFGFLGGLTLGPWAFGTLIDLTNGYTASFVMVAVSFVVSIAILAVRPRGAT